MSLSQGVAPTRHHFTPIEENTLCTDNLGWAENLLRKHYGKRAVEWAGEGLLAACRSFDPDRGDSFRGFAATVIRRTAARGLRQMYGAPGTDKHESMASSVTFEDYDQQASIAETTALLSNTITPDQLNAEDADEYLVVLDFIDRQPMRRRLIGLGAMLTNLTSRQLSEVLHIDRREIVHTLTDLRRLVSAA
ncbi:MAG: hypothetical protein JKX85_06185 [Phycisphaeraceae bacterium]|nr:hypothetical protein [Phycisphaeraceae bacterium]